ncbi:jg8345 [Pararge aegeria aegeria]|uniref:Jg8345 protein n=1 Tax=Pararge aegeria aegeria TaxID=348720 RepID=A0A8S4SIF6_9NEOP|nr:jg8345 [Pararge aegeria aegeria]
MGGAKNSENGWTLGSEGAEMAAPHLSVEEKRAQKTLMFPPLTKESKQRRHIRSMSDVQSSTPYCFPFRSRKGLHPTLTYDSDKRAKCIASQTQIQ